MPNWCVNYMTVSHLDPEKMQELIAAYKDGSLLNYAVPMPEDLNITRHFDPDLTEAAQRQRNVEKYGYEDWYDWRVANWGTKWDVLHSQDPQIKEDGSISLTFDSAWSPPLKAYEALKAQGFKIDAEFTEEGRFFVGYWRDGTELIVSPDDAPPELSHLVEYWRRDDEEVA